MTTIPPTPDEALVTISTPTADTVRIRDRVESSRFEFYFDDDVDITPAPTDSIYFPVDVAARLDGDWSELTIPQIPRINARNKQTGSMVATCSRNNPVMTLGGGEYNVELSSAPMKLYLSVIGAIKIERRQEEVHISKQGNGSFILGVRSFHDQPAEEITTTPTVPDLMESVSYLSSGLKTTSPERSWPTLRGHPPKIEIGDKLDVPQHLEKPKTDVYIEIPRKIDSILEVAPLAYYAAATVRPVRSDADNPGIVANGERFEFSPDSIGKDAFRTLRDIFILDCVVRTEGYYPLPLQERSEVESALSWEPADVYDLPIADRISRYMAVPEDVVEKIRPRWPLTVDIVPDLDNVPAIPYLAEELPRVRCGSSEDVPSPSPDYLQSFTRDGSGITRSKTVGRGENECQPSTFTPNTWNTQLHVSLGEGYPIGSNKTSIESLRKHTRREKPSSQSIEVHVICNEEDMREEEVVTEFYGVRDLLEFDVNIHHSVTAEDFEELLTSQIDLIHYIGHIDEEGMLCSDGYLDAYELDYVNIDAFILNACQSVYQGEALLDAGANGGVVTLFDVPNSSATKVGRSLSRLLNRGFDLRSAVEIARESSVLGRRWISIGDGRLVLTQAETGVPSILNIWHKGGDKFTVEVEGFGTNTHGVGTLRTPNFGFEKNHVHPTTQSGTVNLEAIEKAFRMETIPVRFEGDLYWTDELSASELLGQVQT